MKTFLSAFALLLVALGTCAQTDTVTNNFDSIYTELNPTAAVNYQPPGQLYNYSRNWDFDGDGYVDELYFIGTGGVHLYYYLRIVFSSDTAHPRNYRFMQTDLPVLPHHVNAANFNPLARYIHFAVYDADSNGTPDIYLRLDEATRRTFVHELNLRGIKSGHVLLSFKRKKEKFTDIGGR